MYPNLLKVISKILPIPFSNTMYFQFISILFNDYCIVNDKASCGSDIDHCAVIPLVIVLYCWLPWSVVCALCKSCHIWHSDNQGPNKFTL